MGEVTDQIRIGRGANLFEETISRMLDARAQPLQDSRRETGIKLPTQPRMRRGVHAKSLLAPGILLQEKTLRHACEHPGIDVLNMVNDPEWYEASGR